MNKAQNVYWSEYVQRRLEHFSRDIQPQCQSIPETPEALKVLISKLENHLGNFKRLSADLDRLQEELLLANKDIRAGK